MSETSAARAATESRSIRRRRPLPGGRAVVGALLVTVSAIGIFVAYSDAASGPSVDYVVAASDVPVGTVIDDLGDAGRWFTTAPAEILGPARDRVVARTELERLVGQVVAHPLAPGDPLLWSVLVPAADVPTAHLLALALAPRDALGGALVVGSHVDVLVTYGSGRDAWTEFVARSVPVVSLDAEAGGGLGSPELLVTVSLDTAEAVQRVGHATRAGEVFLSRSTSNTIELPSPFRVDPPGAPPDQRAPGFHEGLPAGEMAP
jgi:Flp pilus assembly protein CpaB